MKRYLLFLIFVSIYFPLEAQKLVGIGTLIQGGVADGQKLIGAYIKPLNEALVVGLSNAAFNGSYDKDDEYRFSLSLNTAFVNIPNEFKTFNVNDLGLVSMESKNPNETVAQTVFGDSTTIQLKSIYGFGFTNARIFSLHTIEGSERNVVPFPFLNATYRMGNLTIGGQVIPPVTLPGTDIRTWLLGGNIQDNLENILPFLEDHFFDLQASAGYYLLSGHSDLEVLPGKVIVNVPLTDDRKGPYKNQELVIHYNAFYTALYASAKLNNFTPFVGAGFNFGVSSIKLKGTYPVFAKSKNSFIGARAEDIENPFTDLSSYARIKFEAGGRFDFGRFFGQFSYTLANYGGISGSLGIKF